MSEALKLFDGIMGETIANIYTSLPCHVVTFYGDTADVQPTLKRKLRDGRELEYPMMVKVPVLKRKYQEGAEIKVETPYYEKGDTVLVSFVNRNLSYGIIIGLLG
jgi:hypothetical protein